MIQEVFRLNGVMDMDIVEVMVLEGALAVVAAEVAFNRRRKRRVKITINNWG